MNPYQPLRIVLLVCLAKSLEFLWLGAACLRCLEVSTFYPRQQLNPSVLLLLCEDLEPISIGDKKSKQFKTLNSGYLGSRNDEERSEMRYVM